MKATRYTGGRDSGRVHTAEPLTAKSWFGDACSSLRGVPRAVRLRLRHLLRHLRRFQLPRQQRSPAIDARTGLKWLHICGCSTCSGRLRVAGEPLMRPARTGSTRFVHLNKRRLQVSRTRRTGGDVYHQMRTEGLLQHACTLEAERDDCTVALESYEKIARVCPKVGLT